MKTKIVGSVIVRNERHRYLPYVLRQLDKCCDEIRIYDDASTDGTGDLIHRIIKTEGFNILVCHGLRATFDKDESVARQNLLDWTYEADPTHIVCIDADEYITDPEYLRAQILERPEVENFNVPLNEIWDVQDGIPYQRLDGGWAECYPPLVYRVNPGLNVSPTKHPQWKIPARALACGRQPWIVANTNRTFSLAVNSPVLHLGWTDPKTRKARYDRYMAIDGGDFHNKNHLLSIMDENPMISPMSEITLPFTFKNGERIDSGKIY